MIKNILKLIYGSFAANIGYFVAFGFSYYFFERALKNESWYILFVEVAIIPYVYAIANSNSINEYLDNLKNRVAFRDIEVWYFILFLGLYYLAFIFAYKTVIVFSFMIILSIVLIAILPAIYYYFLLRDRNRNFAKILASMFSSNAIIIAIIFVPLIFMLEHPTNFLYFLLKVLITFIAIVLFFYALNIEYKKESLDIDEKKTPQQQTLNILFFTILGAFANYHLVNTSIMQEAGGISGGLAQLFCAFICGIASIVSFVYILKNFNSKMALYWYGLIIYAIGAGIIIFANIKPMFFKYNYNKYIRDKYTITLEDIAKKYKIDKERLLNYNKITKKYLDNKTLNDTDYIVYLTSKECLIKTNNGYAIMADIKKANIKNLQNYKKNITFYANVDTKASKLIDSSKIEKLVSKNYDVCLKSYLPNRLKELYNKTKINPPKMSKKEAKKLKKIYNITNIEQETNSTLLVYDKRSNYIQRWIIENNQTKFSKNLFQIDDDILERHAKVVKLYTNGNILLVFTSHNLLIYKKYKDNYRYIFKNSETYTGHYKVAFLDENRALYVHRYLNSLAFIDVANKSIKKFKNIFGYTKIDENRTFVYSAHKVYLFNTKLQKLSKKPILKGLNTVYKLKYYPDAKTLFIARKVKENLYKLDKYSFKEFNKPKLIASTSFDLAPKEIKFYSDYIISYLKPYNAHGYFTIYNRDLKKLKIFPYSKYYYGKFIRIKDKLYTPQEREGIGILDIKEELSKPQDIFWDN